MKNKKPIIISIITCIATIVLFFSYKSILRWQVEKRVSGVEFKDVSLNTSGITLHSVYVDKGWLKGSLDTLTSDFQGEHILIEGGNLSVNLDERTNKESDTATQKRDIQFHDLQVSVTYKKYNAILQEVRSSGSNICFAKAKVENTNIAVTDGCFNKDTKIASIEKAELDKVEVKGVQLTDLTAHHVEINTKEKTAKVDELKSQLIFENHTFHIEANKLHGSKNSETITAESVKVLHPWLATDWITLEKIKVQKTDKIKLSVKYSNVEIDPITLSISGSEDCSTWVDSLPSSLQTSPLNQVKLTGKTSFSITLRPKPNFTLKSDCKATCSTLPNLRKPFKYTAYTSKRDAFERESGLGTKEWIPLDMMGAMPIAAPAMEDPGFPHHRGFITQAFANSLTDNLKEGRFFRGGSTITMQLVKNIWLTREKTLGRKVQEFFLAQAVESCYSKDDIIELYLNVVEFGPNKYGVASGAQHWFKKSPMELSAVEAFWLASILPRPNRTGPPTEDSLKRIKSLVKKLATDKRIPDVILEMIEQEKQLEELDNN